MYIGAPTTSLMKLSRFGACVPSEARRASSDSPLASLKVSFCVMLGPAAAGTRLATTACAGASSNCRTSWPSSLTVTDSFSAADGSAIDWSVHATDMVLEISGLT